MRSDSTYLAMQEPLNAEESSVFQTAYIPADLKMLLDLHKLIELHFKEQREAEFYGRSLNISLKRLNRLTFAYADKSVYRILQERLHQEAEMLLKHSTLSAKQIAFELGVCDPAHFSKCFKRVSGMSPLCYRKLHERRISLSCDQELKIA